MAVGGLTAGEHEQQRTMFQVEMFQCALIALYEV